jgi:hypothetical protein
MPWNSLLCQRFDRRQTVNSAIEFSALRSSNKNHSWVKRHPSTSISSATSHAATIVAAELRINADWSLMGRFYGEFARGLFTPTSQRAPRLIFGG